MRVLDRGDRTAPHGDPLAGLPEGEFPPPPPARCACCGNELRRERYAVIVGRPLFEGPGSTFETLCERCHGVFADRIGNLADGVVASALNDELLTLDNRLVSVA